MSERAKNALKHVHRGNPALGADALSTKAKGASESALFEQYLQENADEHALTELQEKMERLQARFDRFVEKVPSSIKEYTKSISELRMAVENLARDVSEYGSMHERNYAEFLDEQKSADE